METLETRYRKLKSDLALVDPTALITFVSELKNFFHNPITVRQAEEEVRWRIATRGERFLSLAQAQVFGRPQSAYRKLFKLAGCELADLRDHVGRYGLEETLEKLARDGVYLTAEEFKGKREVARGGKSFLVDPRDLEISPSGPSLVMQTTGASNQPRKYLMPIPAFASRAVPMCVFFSAHDLFSSSYAVYDAILPANGGVRDLLVRSGFGLGAERWFARTVPQDSRLGSAWNLLMTYLIVLLGNFFGPGLPRPRFVDPENVQPILDWVLKEKRRGKSCCIRSTASNAARIARAAWEQGVSLERTTFFVSGEPFTEAKRDAIERAGAKGIIGYGFEGGAIAFGCVNPAYIDEMHLDSSKLALIARPHPLAAAPEIHPLLVTTFDEPGPKFYLNVELGDYGALSDRRCGCPMEAVGFTRHIHGIRSYEKFTAEGMNYFYGDLFELLEKTLPAEFGGGPGDYQLVEEEDAAGQTRLMLAIHPRVGDLSEQKVFTTVLAALAEGSPANDFQSKIWQTAGTLKIRRQVPFVTARGKILPLHISRAF
jgi:hypothetical protein